MISKAKIKEVRSLHLQKYRQIYNKFIVEGGKACIEFIKNEKFIIKDIFITEISFEKYDQIKEIKKYNVTVITIKEMEQISSLMSVSDILIVALKAEDSIDVLQIPEKNAIYLDNVQDPGNVGTIIRIADWFGVDVVVRSPESADFFNPKVVQATMGSMTNVALVTATLPKLTKFNRKIYGTYMNGTPISNISIPDNAIIVMGNEGKGISSENEPLINNKISIQGAQNRIAESLNVAIATGIICSHWKNPKL